ncbi:hypothetical protein D6817_04280 [Candidatus Pacearchaeota archaeon]|nr:MAG: hypothetical protein D6817_04280 [Candidatus Pacearchaeota archaeon]
MASAKITEKDFPKIKNKKLATASAFSPDQTRIQNNQHPASQFSFHKSAPKLDKLNGKERVKHLEKVIRG